MSRELNPRNLLNPKIRDQNVPESGIDFGSIPGYLYSNRSCPNLQISHEQ